VTRTVRRRNVALVGAEVGVHAPSTCSNDASSVDWGCTATESCRSLPSSRFGPVRMSSLVALGATRCRGCLGAQSGSRSSSPSSSVLPRSFCTIACIGSISACRLTIQQQSTSTRPEPRVVRWTRSVRLSRQEHRSVSVRPQSGARAIRRPARDGRSGRWHDGRTPIDAIDTESVSRCRLPQCAP
jgi:hypothetical protein